MTTGYYTKCPSEKWPLSYHQTRPEAETALPSIQDRYPGASVVSVDDYWVWARAQAMAQFPLTEITQHFYEEMLNVMPPSYKRGCPGFFICEAVTDSVHTQFIEHRGRYYAGNADISPGGKTWTIEDIDYLVPADGAPLLNRFPKEETETP